MKLIFVNRNSFDIKDKNNNFPIFEKVYEGFEKIMSYIIEHRTGTGVTRKIVDTLPRNMMTPEQRYMQDFLPLHMLPDNDIKGISKARKTKVEKELSKRKPSNRDLREIRKETNKKRIKKPKIDNCLVLDIDDEII